MTAALPAVRGPNEWPEAQRAFGARLQAGDVPPETPVRARWVSNEQSSFGGGLGPNGPIALVVKAALALGRRKTRGPGGAYVLVWLEGTAMTEPADLIVPVDPDDLPSPSGETDPGDAVVLGEVAPNGALAVDLGGGVIVLPSFNPQVAWGDRRRLGRRP